ncbi:unnamed protein product [Cladocopium goreaui]|uniref:Uncharacterized protein n=1 Tax=Cladocopium goreaui TaxID=2562237 RepID=A0A9P1DFF6_9DINO|nr:unnamed protein product [Cladocopium goreaui]
MGRGANAKRRPRRKDQGQTLPPTPTSPADSGDDDDVAKVHRCLHANARMTAIWRRNVRGKLSCPSKRRKSASCSAQAPCRSCRLPQSACGPLYSDYCEGCWDVWRRDSQDFQAASSSPTILPHIPADKKESGSEQFHPSVRNHQHQQAGAEQTEPPDGAAGAPQVQQADAAHRAEFAEAAHLPAPSTPPEGYA